MATKRKQLIFWIVYLAYTSIYMARVNLSMAGPDMIDEGILDTVQLGLLGSVFSTLYSVGRLINGGLSDKTPPWVMLTTGLAVAGLSNILIGFFPPFIGIFILWTTNAYAQSMLWSSVLCVVAGIYDQETAKKKTSVMVSSVATGNILAIIITTALITKLGLRFAFVVPGAITIALGIAVFFTTRCINPDVKVEKSHISMWELIKDREIALMCIPSMFHGVMKENISLWMTVYVVDTYFVDLSTSSYYILLIPILGFIGRTIYPAVYKMCKNKENTVSASGFVICLASALMLCFSGVGMIASVLALSLIYAAVSMINTSMLSIYPIRYVDTGNVASVSGIMDFATYLGGGVASFIYGIVIKNFGYMPMFVSWAVISVISTIVLRIVSDKKA